ncbi:MAG: AMP-binding protein [Clostridiales bacterium]|nr:AMP-binding protein [Clostridiales bacterium]
MTTAFYPVRAISDFKDLLMQSAEIFSERTAFSIKKNGEYVGITYPQFRDDVFAFGAALNRLFGLECSRVALIGENSYEWCVSYLAVTCGSGVIVPIDKDLDFDDIASIISVSKSKAIIADEAKTKLLLEKKEQLNDDLIIITMEKPEGGQRQVLDPALIQFSFKGLIEKGKSSAEDLDAYQKISPDPNVMSVLLFTSGTTGASKGVMLSQYNICSDITSLAGVVKINPTDKLLTVLPLHHTYQCTLGFLMMMYSGGNVAFSEGLRYIVQNMQEFKPTLFLTVPLMLEKIHKRIIKAASQKHGGKLALTFGKAISGVGAAFGVNLKERLFGEIQKNFGGELRMIITGAAAISPTVVKDFQAFGLPVYIGYGLTECSPLVIGNNDRIQLPDSVGVPLPGVEAKILNPDSDGVGEIAIKGPMVMLGYYENEEATAEVLQDGWLRTGDLGTVDDEGNFRIAGRSKNVIVTKTGKNIYPEEVEYHLNINPLIAESMVVAGNEDDDGDTSVRAKIFPDIEAIKEKLKLQNVTKEQISKVVQDVIKEVNKKLPRYKNIKSFDIRESEFVKTTTHKIKRFANILDNDEPETQEEENE